MAILVPRTLRAFSAYWLPPSTAFEKRRGHSIARSERTMTRLLWLAVVIASCACGASQVVAPTPTLTSTPSTTPTFSSSTWDVTIQTTAVKGPDFCIFTPSVGAVFRGTYQLAWYGDSVSFSPPDPIDWDSFTARLSASNFAGANAPMESGGGMCAHYLQASTLTGNFSTDDNSFEAIENLAYILDSGQVKTVTFSWSGRRH
jgi:hypothetical protein